MESLFIQLSDDAWIFFYTELYDWFCGPASDLTDVTHLRELVEAQHLFAVTLAVAALIHQLFELNQNLIVRRRHHHERRQAAHAGGFREESGVSMSLR